LVVALNSAGICRLISVGTAEDHSLELLGYILERCSIGVTFGKYGQELGGDSIVLLRFGNIRTLHVVVP